MLMIAAVVAARERRLNQPKRRVVARTDGGWEASTLNGYVLHGDEQTYREQFRTTTSNFKYVTKMLRGAGFVKDNQGRNPAARQTAAFKVGVALYFFAGHGHGDMKAVGDATPHSRWHQGISLG